MDNLESAVSGGDDEGDTQNDLGHGLSRKRSSRASWRCSSGRTAGRLGPLHHESYLHVDEVRGDAYGFGGLTQERRYIAGKLEAVPHSAAA
jgi:4-oxalocrotonate tautomerase